MTALLWRMTHSAFARDVRRLGWSIVGLTVVVWLVMAGRDVSGLGGYILAALAAASALVVLLAVCTTIWLCLAQHILARLDRRSGGVR